MNSISRFEEIKTREEAAKMSGERDRMVRNRDKVWPGPFACYFCGDNLVDTAIRELSPLLSPKEMGAIETIATEVVLRANLDGEQLESTGALLNKFLPLYLDEVRRRAPMRPAF